MATDAEFDRLRTELRDVRYLTEAILHALVGDKAIMYEIDARIASENRRTRCGTPLKEIGIRGRVLERFTSSWHDGLDVVTVEEAARLPRGRVAAIDGLGRKSMRKLDAALAERGLTWAEVA